MVRRDVSHTLLAVALVLVVTGCGSAKPQPAFTPEAAPATAPDAAPAEPAPAAAPAAPVFQLEITEADEGLRPDLERWVKTGRSVVEQYFGEPFLEGLTVLVHPDRAAFTASFPAEWGLTQTQCWMVAYGVADRLSLLSPGAWAREACEHDANDDVHVQRIITHELVHAFHGQHNPTRDFTGIEEATGWFAEGLAVLVSGQLDEERLAGARRAVAQGRGPVTLTGAWSGPDRYGVCGSLVAFLEARIGRDGILRLLAATDFETFLEAAGLTEQQWLDEWQLDLAVEQEP